MNKVILFTPYLSLKDVLKAVELLGLSLGEVACLNDLRLNPKLIELVETKGFDWVGEVVTVDAGRKFYVFCNSEGSDGEYVVYCDTLVAYSVG